MKRTLYAFFLLTLVFTSCRSGKQFTSPDAGYGKITNIAVLPARVYYTGNLPKDFSQAMADSLAQEQGRAFQTTLLNNLIQYSGGSKKMPGAGFQSADKTNGLLRKSGLSWKEILERDPDELAALLGVDAVVRMNVTSDRLMSDLASLGLGTLRNILFWGTSTAPVWPASIPNKTAEVYAQCALQYKGKTLWTAEYRKETDWNTSIRDVMAVVCKKMGKGFPY